MSATTDPGGAPATLAHFQVPVATLTTNGTDRSVTVVTGDMVRVLDLGLRAELARFRHDTLVSDIAADPVPRLLVPGTDGGRIRGYPWPGQ